MIPELLSMTREEAHLPECCPECGAPKSPRLLVAHIQATVAAYYHIPPAEMWSTHRNREYAYPRQIAMYLARELTARSYPEIARRFGKQDHTTILHAFRSVQNRALSDRELSYDIEVLRERLTAFEIAA